MAEVERIEGELTLGDNHYSFYLHHRTVTLGQEQSADYYYMPAGELRSGDPEAEVSNFRSCIGLWQAASYMHGDRDSLEQQEHYAMAVAYALFNQDKGQQEIYRDARLRAGAICPGELSVSEEASARINRAMNRRDWSLVRDELKDALDAIDLSREDEAGIAAAVGQWRFKGAQFFRAGGQEGLLLWLKLVEYWTAKYRKRCPPQVRTFINYFAYDAKTCFYTCYATFWSHLIPWLEEHRALSPISARLLRVWHNQPQPMLIEHGRTQQGILYPVGGGAAIPPEHAGGGPSRVAWQSPQIGPTYVADVFGGQVLALHPIGELLLDDPALSSIIGKCLVSPKFDAAMASGNVNDFGEYWDIIGAIMTAAHMYQQARRNYEASRGVTILDEEAVGPMGDEGQVPLSMEAVLAEFLEVVPRPCQCGGTLGLRPQAKIQPATDGCMVMLPVRCRACERDCDVEVTWGDLSKFLHRDDGEAEC